jgi:hypothetical protein
LESHQFVFHHGEDSAINGKHTAAADLADGSFRADAEVKLGSGGRVESGSLGRVKSV